MFSLFSAQSIRTVIRVAGSVLITALLLYAVFTEQSLESLWELIRGVNKKGVILYIFISCAALYFRALRYQWILRTTVTKESCPRTTEILVVTAIRNALVDFLPARLGELSFFYILHRYGVALVSALTTFGLCIALDIIVLLLLVLFFLALSPLFSSMDFLEALWSRGDGAGNVLLLALLLLAVLTALGVLLARLDALLSISGRALTAVQGLMHWPGWLNNCMLRLAQTAEHIARELKQIRQQKIYGKLIVITILLRVAKYGSLYILLISTVIQWGITGKMISPVLTSIAFLVAEASASLPISGLMGFGMYEGAWSAIFSLSRVEIPSLTSVILVVHLITQVVGYSFAFFALAVFLIKEIGLRYKSL